MFSILLVDDESYVVDTLEATVPWADIGIEYVYTANDGGEALAVLEKRRIDIVVTDIQMPGMTGLELIRRVRDAWPKTKCILLSGYADFHFAQQAIQSQAIRYLLKPIADEELIGAVEETIEQIQEEWREISSFRNATYALKEHLPLLRGTLLAELLQGRKYSEATLTRKLRMLELPISYGEPVAIVIVRVEEAYGGYENENAPLLDFSIQNIFEEICEGGFRLWGCKDVHDYCVFLVRGSEGMHPECSGESARHALEEAAAHLQAKVRTFLKSRISIALSRWCAFPADLSETYSFLVAEMRKRIGGDCELLISTNGLSDPKAVQTLQALYEPPMMTHLLDAGRWEAAERKLADVFAEVRRKLLLSTEHLMEIYLNIAGAYTYTSHKNGALLEEIVGSASGIRLERLPIHSLDQLEEWSNSVLKSLQERIESEGKSSRSSIIREVQSFIERHLAEDVSLRAVADAVYLHPNYLSTLYKSETGESISEYIYRLRMDRAAYLLKQSKHKVYEIAHRLGYQSPHYFIKVFKKQYGVTPQEYRDQT